MSNFFSTYFRACRLKKKAQHEANKIKLYGLEQEHRGMLSLLEEARGVMLKKIEQGGNAQIPAPSHPQNLPGTPPQNQQLTLSQHVEKLAKYRNSKFQRDFQMYLSAFLSHEYIGSCLVCQIHQLIEILISFTQLFRDKVN